MKRQVVPVLAAPSRSAKMRSMRAGWSLSITHFEHNCIHFVSFAAWDCQCAQASSEQRCGVRCGGRVVSHLGGARFVGTSAGACTRRCRRSIALDGCAACGMCTFCCLLRVVVNGVVAGIRCMHVVAAFAGRGRRAVGDARAKRAGALCVWCGRAAAW